MGLVHAVRAMPTRFTRFSTVPMLALRYNVLLLSWSTRVRRSIDRRRRTSLRTSYIFFSPSVFKCLIRSVSIRVRIIIILLRHCINRSDSSTTTWSRPAKMRKNVFFFNLFFQYVFFYAENFRLKNDVTV